MRHCDKSSFTVTCANASLESLDGIMQIHAVNKAPMPAGHLSFNASMACNCNYSLFDFAYLLHFVLLLWPMPVLLLLLLHQLLL
jgi:hypothetical protein